MESATAKGGVLSSWEAVGLSLGWTRSIFATVSWNGGEYSPRGMRESSEATCEASIHVYASKRGSVRTVRNVCMSVCACRHLRARMSLRMSTRTKMRTYLRFCADEVGRSLARG